MTGEEKHIYNRLKELADRSYTRGIWTYSEFLSLSEQSLLTVGELARSGYRLFGGYEGAERAVAVFGSADTGGYEEEPPVTCVKIEPADRRFAGELGHRDFLGTVMSLGLKRGVIGDIVAGGSTGYVCCLESVADYICENLDRVRHTPVKCSIEPLPSDFAGAAPEEKTVFVNSLRLDGAVSAVYGLSRNQAKELFDRELVYLNAKQVQSPSAQLTEGDIVSVRGYGRFVYVNTEGETRKGRLCIRIKVFGRK